MATQIGSIETNIARGWPLELSGFAGTTELERVETGALTARTLLGSFTTTHRLGLVDLKVMAFVIERWRSQGGFTASDHAAFTLYQLGKSIYGREPDGEERRLLRESIQRLFRVEINAQGHVGSSSDGRIRKLARDGRVFVQKDTVWDDVDPAALDASLQIASRRGRSFRVWLGPWLVEQIRAGHVTYLTFSTMRKLSGLALRLWVFLEGEPFVADVDHERLATPQAISPELLAVLGVGHSRATDGRRAINRAGDRVCAVDDRYRSIALVKRDGQWWLDPVRATPAPRSAPSPQLALALNAEAAMT